MSSSLVQAFGINVPRMITLTYGFGVGLAALASVMLPVLIGVFLGAVQLATWFDDFYSSDTNRRIVQRIYSETWLQDVVHRAQPYFDRGSNPEQWEQKVADKVQENLPKLLQEISSRTVGLAATRLVAHSAAPTHFAQRPMTRVPMSVSRFAAFTASAAILPQRFATQHAGSS